jgi:WhiB family transcriptional regulator, redox-sensing transcriptional regulator
MGHHALSGITVPGWQDRAGCIGADPDLFFPITPHDETAAKAICAWCPVRAGCRAFADEHAIGYGIWGGLTEDERRRERRLALRRDRERRARAQGRAA